MPTVPCPLWTSHPWQWILLFNYVPAYLFCHLTVSASRTGVRLSHHCIPRPDMGEAHLN